MPSTVTGLPALTIKRVLSLYYPLGLSWLFMSIETPTAIWIISRMAEPKINTAGYLIMGALALWIESPVIDLLASSTTLARSRESYFSMRKFAVWMIIWVSVAHILASCTPAYGFLTQNVMKLKPEIVSAVHKPFIIMIPWSGFIGWRRYLQGMMIRSGHTKIIGVGTLVRFSTMLGVGYGLYLLADGLTGLAVASIALVSSVAAEAVFIHFVSRPIVAKVENTPTHDGNTVTLKKIAAFHLPLTAATMITLTNTPLVGAALARTPDAIDSMAAWQVAMTFLGLFRTVTFALNEVVISLYHDEEARAVLRDFCLLVGAIVSGLAVVSHLTGVDRWVFASFLGSKPEIATLACIGFIAAVGTPVINAIMSYYRGILTSRHVTTARLIAIVAGISTLFACLAFGVAARWPGVIVAASSLTTAMLVELVVLAVAWLIYTKKTKESSPIEPQEIQQESPEEL